jgi:FSR family fosmidomycin resistance protein-like MFS transporter
MGVVSLGHLFTDVSQGSVPALLPFLKSHMHLSYAAVSALVLAATISSSVIQPLFGRFSDRRSFPQLMPLGVFFGGLGIALVGIAPSYALVFLAIVVSGIGVAAFHPEGSRFANYLSGTRRASGMSLFSVGGNVGFALGPVLVTPLVLAFGLHGTLFMAIPAALMALVLLHELPRLDTFRHAAAKRLAKVGVREQWNAFLRLGAVVAMRSFVYFGLVTFVPLYFVAQLHSSKAAGNTALTAMLAAGAVGTLIGGPAADRFGRKPVVIASMAVLPPLIIAFAAAGQGLATVLIAIVGAATIITFSVTVVMGQEYLPGRIGVASGFTLGLSIGLGGVAAPLLGLVADRYGLPTTIHVIAALPVIGLLVALTLPRAGGRAPQRA